MARHSCANPPGRPPVVATRTSSTFGRHEREPEGGNDGHRPLLIRLAVGVIVAAHGAQKLFGWFAGHGLRGTAGFLESLGFRPGRPYAGLLGGTELAAGLALAAGFLTPLAAAGVAGVMLAAVAVVHWDKGFFNMDGGYEFPLGMAVGAAAMAFSGAAAGPSTTPSTGRWPARIGASPPWCWRSSPAPRSLPLAVSGSTAAVGSPLRRDPRWRGPASLPVPARPSGSTTTVRGAVP